MVSLNIFQAPETLEKVTQNLIKLDELISGLKTELNTVDLSFKHPEKISSLQDATVGQSEIVSFYRKYLRSIMSFYTNIIHQLSTLPFDKDLVDYFFDESRISIEGEKMVQDIILAAGKGSNNSDFQSMEIYNLYLSAKETFGKNIIHSLISQHLKSKGLEPEGCEGYAFKEIFKRLFKITKRLIRECTSKEEAIKLISEEIDDYYSNLRNVFKPFAKFSDDEVQKNKEDFLDKIRSAESYEEIVINLSNITAQTSLGYCYTGFYAQRAMVYDFKINYPEIQKTNSEEWAEKVLRDLTEFLEVSKIMIEMQSIIQLLSQKVFLPEE